MSTIDEYQCLRCGVCKPFGHFGYHIVQQGPDQSAAFLCFDCHEFINRQCETTGADYTTIFMKYVEVHPERLYDIGGAT